MTSISPQLHTHFLFIKNTAALWKALEQRYNSTSRAHIHQIKETLIGLTKGQRSMQEYLDQCKALTDQLALLNEYVPEEDLILYTLRVL